MKQKILFFLVFSCASVYLVTHSTVLAHSGGYSYEKSFGDYLIDVGREEELVAAGQPIRFDFNLLNEKSKLNTEFTDVWVKISKEKNTIFATGIVKARVGATGMVFDFPETGEYELYVRFHNGSPSLAEATFTVQVQAGEEEKHDRFNISNIALTAGIAIVFGLIAGFLISRKLAYGNTEAR